MLSITGFFFDSPSPFPKIPTPYRLRSLRDGTRPAILSESERLLK